ncbi:hypothetical protein ACE1B6_12425 [Aerosakkonemataceae cyanobacterium BLCC-F154]|uniref:Uncharacterized protein n=1 Tax=Floridaenema fluviatile BLCC-F154 TaxID=3153640 RepID=A0ABV4YB49_9CYAN
MTKISPILTSTGKASDLLYSLRSTYSRRGRSAFGEVDVGAGLVDNLFR